VMLVFSGLLCLSSSSKYITIRRNATQCQCVSSCDQPHAYLTHPLRCLSGSCSFIHDPQERVRLLDACLSTLAAQEDAVKEFRQFALSKVR
jgi:hypothetical protein